MGGQILAADENDGQVHAIASDGTVTSHVFDWVGAEGVILPPVNNDGSSVFKRQGVSTIPAKFIVCDADGNPISDPNAVFANGCCGSITILSRMRGKVDSVNASGTADIPDVAFHYVGDHWQFNLVLQTLRRVTPARSRSFSKLGAPSSSRWL